MQITNEEIEALKKYQANDYKIINMLLREGINSEHQLFNKFPKFLEEVKSFNFTEYFNNIKLIYSAIIKYSIKENNNQDCYRGTSLKTIEELMSTGANTSFMSSSTNKSETLKFSTKPDKNGERNLENRAFCKIEGNVPFIDLEKILGGGEDEIIFAPSNINIKFGVEQMNNAEQNRYGKLFTIELSPIVVPKKSEKEIKNLEISTKLKAKEMMNLLTYLLELKKYNNDSHKLIIDKLSKEYSEWKNQVIDLCYQEFENIKSYLYSQNIEKNQSANFSEIFEQDIIDYNKNTIGKRTVVENYNYENGNKNITTTDLLENEDGVYSIISEEIGIGDQLIHKNQEIKKYNKNTKENEYFKYQKNPTNELFFHQINGKISIKIYRNSTGITIDYYGDNNQVTDSYEYDIDGQPIFGNPDIPVLNEEFITNYMNGYIPYFNCSSMVIENDKTKSI